VKVLHLINTLSAGGAELHLLTLCRHLKRRGLNLVVACLKEEVSGSRSLRPDFHREGIPVIDLHAERRFEARCIPRLFRLLRAHQPALIHTHLPRADFVGAFSRLLSPTVPWIASVHDIYNRSWSGSWTLPLFNYVWRRADAVIAISQAVQDWLVCNQQLPEAKVTVIQYGIEVERFAPKDAGEGFAPRVGGSLIVGTIGRLEPRKGHEYLIRAMPDVLRWVPQATLRVAGHDPWGYGPTLQAVVAELGIEAQVRLVGFASDVPAFLHALDVFALASRSEGFGQVVIEAMAAGKPVVASRIGALTEIVVDGETGLLVEPENPKAVAEAIVWLLTHREAAQHMGRCGQERVRHHFSAEQMAAKTLALYQQVLSARR
jgi:glycosyltransferase involved in cell wall biosynthesis